MAWRVGPFMSMPYVISSYTFQVFFLIRQKKVFFKNIFQV